MTLVTSPNSEKNKINFFLSARNHKIPNNKKILYKEWYKTNPNQIEKEIIRSKQHLLQNQTVYTDKGIPQGFIDYCLLSLSSLALEINSIWNNYENFLSYKDSEREPSEKEVAESIKNYNLKIDRVNKINLLLQDIQTIFIDAPLHFKGFERLGVIKKIHQLCDLWKNYDLFCTRYRELNVSLESLKPFVPGKANKNYSARVLEYIIFEVEKLVQLYNIKKIHPDR
ncbi:hypothetical protein [Legionella sainthelensi]|uniref:hypothetical protein n=1 Tax=Legionella sainthelensi TaxID=28087 RepID=UPI000E200A49|nr:hypothetical protein [Legionella sainthelensi]